MLGPVHWALGTAWQSAFLAPWAVWELRGWLDTGAGKGLSFPVLVGDHRTRGPDVSSPGPAGVWLEGLHLGLWDMGHLLGWRLGGTELGAQGHGSQTAMPTAERELPGAGTGPGWTLMGVDGHRGSGVLGGTRGAAGTCHLSFTLKQR